MLLNAEIFEKKMKYGQKKSWRKVAMSYTTDENGKEVLLKDGKFQVMMEWEKPYMQACIDALQPFGDVLEIGYGCGYSAARIQSYHPKSHTIIECDPEVARRARQFAGEHHNVVIIEDTWQKALDSLGIFDIVFFDDYPLESRQQMSNMEKAAGASHMVIKKGQQVLADANQLLSEHLQQKYKNEDLLEFFQLAEEEASFGAQQLLRFFNELKAAGQITERQYEFALQKMVEKKWLDPKDLESFGEPVPAAPFRFNEKGDRLFEFLSRCLEKHMRKGSRFSCFLEDPASRYEDKKFFEHIITNPYLEYTERRIEIKVPENCRYYKGNTALVITITKMLS
ncbi:MAG TPA: class I SAM-dependent methyltransferase [Rhabdochlamydiaceae bacterium]|nr:class I SAM-dependent methyltransferase [Rhabdochlamydiaceae bacterium]